MTYANDSPDAIAAMERARTGYKRMEKGKAYYACHVHQLTEAGDVTDGFKYSNGEYINDYRLCRDRERAYTLHRRLEQWQALNDEPVDLHTSDVKIYNITYGRIDKELYPIYNEYLRHEGTVYFSTKEKAEEAIEVFCDELMWYFTEYLSRLDEPRCVNKEN